ncbi:protein kinase [Micromonospora sp. WMMC241]|uniref:serine/threonine-protein kinase n=1 Tax=Micromonospora sp. WMMC241 TaxID=3015159 RepID=UPI0022B6E19D|nr:serine/threonine-protein kinase [Micromonospora sp. WMMC241]MCZ7436914.1 protein kinase [Micromonospora sp. WMMC241]
MNDGLRPGDPARLGGYELLGRLGEGGMGSVFLARSPQGRRVAVKVVRAELSHHDEFRGRFRSEVNRARQVPPFCTAEVLDADPDHEPPYLVVEYVDGPSLVQVVRDQGPMTTTGVHGIAVGVATALTAIHGAGVIHRDLKPANVLVAPGGIKVIDFGIARAFEATSQHTRTNQMVGTVAYMAPERFETTTGNPVGPAADIFAWGAVVAFAATGRTPFEGESATATAMRILTQPPDLTGLDGPLRALVSRALEKDPADRPTARELLDGLLTTASPSGDAGRLPNARAAVTPGAAGAATARPPADAAGDGDAPDPDPGAAERRRRRRRLVGLVAGAVVVAALVPAALFGSDLLPDGTGSEPAGVGSPAASATTAGAPTPGGSPSTSPASRTPSRSPSATADRTRAMLAGQRRLLLHVVQADRDLSLPFDGELTVGDGTGRDALFVLEPVGVDYLIKSVNPDISHRPCLGVKLDAERNASLVGTECEPTAATMFGILREGKDDKGRTSYAIVSDRYGLVQWDESRREIYVQELGDAPIDTTFSLVDRGAV